MGVNLRIVEGPQGPPPDITKIVATLAWCPALAVSDPDTEIAQVDTLSGLRDAIGYSIGTECVSRRVRISQSRGLLMSHNPSVAGSISAVTQTGLGPLITVAADNTHPCDDASVIVKVSKGGALGVAEVQISHGYNVIQQGNVQRLYGAAQLVPARLSATITGTKDLTTLTYAQTARVTGTADVSDPTLYGSGGSLAGKTIIVAFDTDTPNTITIPSGASAPANLDALIAYLDTACGNFTYAGDVTATNFPYIVFSGRVLGTGGEVMFTGGTALSLLGLTAATRAKALGNVNIASFNFNSGNALNGLTVIIDEDTTTAQTVTFDNTITSPSLLLAALNGGTTNLSFSLNGSNYLQVESDTYGTASTISLGAGTAHSALFGTPTVTSPGTGTTYGTAGQLDGLTVILDEDTGGAQTITFGSGASAVENAAAVVSVIGAATNISAALYSSQNYLSISSDTIGSSSSLAITGGTALTALGLTASATPATGAESTISIEHLGITCTFPAGTYRVGATYAFTTKAPMPSVSEVEDRLRELDASGADFAVVHIAAPFLATDALALANALDALGAEWEAREGSPRAVHFVIGVDPNESDAVVKATFAAFRSRRVDIAARGAYISSGVINGGASLLRSQSWPAADADALIEFYQDRGERQLQVFRNGFPEVRAITQDENTALVKMVNPSGMRFNVMVADTPSQIHFKGGYTSADASSAFTDASVRNVVYRGFIVLHAQLRLNQNRTDLDVNPDKTLTEASADRVVTSILPNMEAALLPLAATAVQVIVDTTNLFYNTRELRGSATIQNRVPARDVTFSVGPGLIVEG